MTSSFPGAPTLGEAARRADIIVEATVERTLAPVWNTPDQRKPDLPIQQSIRAGFVIFTPFVFDITRVLKGNSPSDGKIILNSMGGQIGKDVIVDEDGPYFSVGQRVVLFLRDCDSERVKRLGSEGFRYAFIQRYIIDKDGNASGILDEGPFALGSLLATIEMEKTLTPLSETSC
jgi:hypothetical protein